MSNKRKASPGVEDQDNQPIHTENRWESLANEDIADRDETDLRHESLLSQYKQLSRTSQLEGPQTPDQTVTYSLKTINKKQARTDNE